MKGKLTFLSGVAAFTLFFAPLSGTFAADGSQEEQTEEVELELITEESSDQTADSVTEGTEEVSEDAGDEEASEVSEGSEAADEEATEENEGSEEAAEEADADDQTEEASDDQVTEDVYEDVTEDVYEDVIEDVYEDVTEDVYEDVTEDVYEDVTEDVYGDVTEDVYDDVTEDVYEDVTEDVYELDYTHESGSKTTNVSLTKEELEYIRAFNDNLVIKKGNVDVTIPMAVLPNNKGVTVTVKEIAFKNALSVFDFTIKTEDGKYISDFGKNPVTIKFVLDPSKVKNWDNLRVYYIANGKRTNEFFTPFKYNKATGEVWVKVTHFSAYGVFEVESSASDDTNTGGANNDSTDKGTTAPAKKDAENKSKTKTASTAKTDSAKSGHALPNTATDNFNLLALGVLVSIMGGALLMIAKLRKAGQSI